MINRVLRATSVVLLCLVSATDEMDRTVMGCGRTRSYEVTPPGEAHDQRSRCPPAKPTGPAKGTEERPGNLRVRPRRPTPPPSSLETSKPGTPAGGRRAP